MTTELTKAAQQALEALDEIHAGKRHPELALVVAHNLRRALTQRPAAQEVDWRELTRRLYVELFYCDQQMTNTYDETGEPMWTTGSAVRDVLRDAKVALEALPAPQQATQSALADAWDEGYGMGVTDERTSEANIGVAGFGAKVNPARQNPYRTQQATPDHVPDAGKMVQADSSEHLRVIASLGAALRRLSFAAQTSGGTAGPDAELQAAIGQAEQALSFGGIAQAMFATPEPVGVFDEFKGRPVLLKTAPMLKHGDLLYTRTAAAPAVPEGMAMVRIKPTDAMIEAGKWALCNDVSDGPEAVIWKAMLTAAPQAPALDAGVVRDAERYRWIAAHCRSTPEHWGGRWSIVVEGPEPKTHDSEDDFDAAIDAAMSAQGATQAERDQAKHKDTP